MNSKTHLQKPSFIPRNRNGNYRGQNVRNANQNRNQKRNGQNGPNHNRNGREPTGELDMRTATNMANFLERTLSDKKVFNIHQARGGNGRVTPSFSFGSLRKRGRPPLIFPEFGMDG